jgi:ligand-binding sensor domain-containing protein
MFTCSHTIAQQVSLFQSIGTQDGLPSNYIMAIEEDANGYLWLGTDKGLAKYDGFSWKTFTTDDGLPGNYIGFIKKAGANGLWIGVSDKGLYHYNFVTKKATPIAQNSFHHFLQTDKNDNLFFYAYGEKSNDTKGYWVSPQRPQQINKAFEIDFNKSIKRLAVDFTSKQIYLIGDNGNTTNQNVAIADKSWQVKKVKGYFEEPSLYETIDSSVFESLSSLYVANASGNVNRVQLFPNENIYFNTLTTPEGYWINNEKDGLYFINKNFEKTHYTTTAGLSSNRVVSMYRLKNGKMLFGTLGGGLCYKLPQNSAQLYIDEPVKGLAQNGNLFTPLPIKIFIPFPKNRSRLYMPFL